LTITWHSVKGPPIWRAASPSSAGRKPTQIGYSALRSDSRELWVIHQDKNVLRVHGGYIFEFVGGLA
jgi:hypothetical protein